jgi:hypothetical protein
LIKCSTNLGGGLLPRGENIFFGNGFRKVDLGTEFLKEHFFLRSLEDIHYIYAGLGYLKLELKLQVQA